MKSAWDLGPDWWLELRDLSKAPAHGCASSAEPHMTAHFCSAAWASKTASLLGFTTSSERGPPAQPWPLSSHKRAPMWPEPERHRCGGRDVRGCGAWRARVRQAARARSVAARYVGPSFAVGASSVSMKSIHASGRARGRPHTAVARLCGNFSSGQTPTAAACAGPQPPLPRRPDGAVQRRSSTRTTLRRHERERSHSE